MHESIASAARGLLGEALAERKPMPHAYTEGQLVEQPAIGLFAEIGWTAVSELEETFDTTGIIL
jgi:hypothetical protein